MSGASQSVDENRARTIGVLTAADLLFFVPYSVWFAIEFIELEERTRGFPRGFTAIWIASWLYAIWTLILSALYLRHLFRDSRAPRNRFLWAALLCLGPVPMAVYWIVYMRRTTHPAQ